MSTFEVDLEIGDPNGERWMNLSLPVDTGSAYTVVPKPLLEGLGVLPFRRARFRLADGRTFDQDIGQTWIRYNGTTAIRIVAFGGEEDEPLLGSDTLQGLLLAVDPVGERLVPVDALRLKLLEVPESQHVYVNCIVNGRQHRTAIPPNRTLLEFVRDDLRLTGAKEGCGTGDCGACSMMVNGKLVTTCLMLAPQADGAEITTIEGVAQNGTLHPVQQAFIDHGAVQCGFCIPGMILAGKALLDREPQPSRERIREAIAGNLCRCTGYTRIVDAIESASGQARA
jgi:aerobic carbon-monoxide dehydrogenase small subunit